MDYQQARQAEASVRMPEQAAGRQLKSITDNRPEAAAQRRLMEGMARGTGVAQRMCTVVTALKQNGCNCGLFSARMAIEALSGLPAGKTGKPTATEYDDAAEAEGSNIGEIFSYNVMNNIVRHLGYNTTQRNFANSATLKTELQATGTPGNPALIAFSNGEYINRLSSRTDLFPGLLRPSAPIGASAPVATTPVATQRGHWSVAEELDAADVLTLCNPHGYRDTIPLGDMVAANQAMDAPGGPQFDWSTFVGGRNYDSMSGRKYALKHTGGSTIATTMDREVIGGGTKSGMTKLQPLDLKGYIVEITT